MADYDYIGGKKRINEIFDSANETEEVSRVPSEHSFTFNNGYRGWVSAIFVDIRNSTELFSDSKNRKTTIAKVMRSFTSEIIEILRNDENIRDIGIRGDCVYAIYANSKQNEDYELFDKAAFVNTFLKMLNVILSKKSLAPIEYGIGLATGEDLVIKAGRDHTNINDLIWIGKAVTFASHLSNLGGANGYNKILISDLFYTNLSEYAKANPTKVSFETNWFTSHNSNDIGTFYDCNVVKSEFNDWVEGGMEDE